MDLKIITTRSVLQFYYFFEIIINKINILFTKTVFIDTLYDNSGIERFLSGLKIP